MTAALVRFDTVRAAPVRVRSAPALDPPYDAAPCRPGPGELQRGGGAPVVRLPATRVTRLDEWRRRGPAGVDVAPTATADDPGRAARSAGESAVQEFTRLLQGVLAGRHAASKLRTWTSTQRWTYLDWLGRYAQTLRKHGVTRARLLQLHMCWPTDSAVEAVAVLEYAGRVRAVPMRFERRGDRWRCTYLSILTPGRKPHD